jgi:membrane-bound lytic murein transglycosylase D
MPDGAARRSIAAGPTRDDERGALADPELRALADAERVLFPRPLAGIEPGWSWDFPERDDHGPEVSSTGVPPVPPLSAPEGSGPAVADAAWLRSLALPDLPVRFEPRLVKYLQFYRDTATGRSIIRSWAKRSGRFAPGIRAALARAGLPKDLVWLSLVESSHNPEIFSPAGAAGLWQFVPETARIYGLTVDKWVDERLDPVRSTEAAVRYLDDLKRRFGTWDLAMAAYNMGHGGLSKAVRKYNTNDYWELSRHEAGVPWETALYVPKILAVAFVMKNPEAFGIADVPSEPAFEFDSVLVGSGVALSRVAQAAGATERAIANLNPQFLTERTPLPTTAAPRGARVEPEDKRYSVRVPRGTALNAHRELSRGARLDPGLEYAVVRFGDDLLSMARERGTTETKLRELNGLPRSEPLVPGTAIIAPKLLPGVRQPLPEVVMVSATLFEYPDRQRVFYRVLAGDTLEGIGSAFGVAAAELSSWNSLDPSARLMPGMMLQVYAPDSKRLEHVCHLTPDRVRPMVVGTPEFIEHHEGLAGKRRILVTVRDGDTLKSIGARYGLSVGSMERINRRSSRDALEVGDTVIVYTTDAALPESPDRSAPLTAAVAPAPELLPP